MASKLIIPVKVPDDETGKDYAVKIDKAAWLLIEDLSKRTNRTRADIASRLIKYAYDNCEVSDGDAE